MFLFAEVFKDFSKLRSSKAGAKWCIHGPSMVALLSFGAGLELVSSERETHNEPVVEKTCRRNHLNYKPSGITFQKPVPEAWNIQKNTPNLKHLTHPKLTGAQKIQAIFCQASGRKLKLTNAAASRKGTARRDLGCEAHHFWIGCWMSFASER